MVQMNTADASGKTDLQPSGRGNDDKFTDARRMRRTLREVFGIEHLRLGQKNVIRAVLAGRDALALMPTGAGKSLCYQLPALYLPGMTVVISPLISLMKDQADKLVQAGVPAVTLNSSLKRSEETEALRRIRDGDVKIVFVTPERFVKAEFIALCAYRRVGLIVVDEAHCVSEWGHDFRPDYLDLAQATETLGRPPLLALTATATGDVVDDVLRHLKMRDPLVVNTGILRENLHFSVRHVTDGREKALKIRETLDFVSCHDGSGIIYAATVKEVERFYDALKAANASVEKYHGKLSAKERIAAQDAFMANECRIIVATNAFGMGIDKPDIRFVVHVQIPASLEAYYQEAGRGGRDGGSAACCLIFDFDDRRIQEFFLSRGHPGAALAIPLLGALGRLSAENNRVAAVTEDEIRQAMPECSRAKVQTALKLLTDAGLVARDKQRRYRLISNEAGAPNPSAEATKQVDATIARYQEVIDRSRSALEEMIRYAQNAQCRWMKLLDYFQCDAPWTRCGTCDNCLRPVTAVSLLEVVEEKPEKEPRFSPGERVRMRRLGEGEIVDIAGDIANVTCADGTVRQILLSYLKAASKTRA